MKEKKDAAQTPNEAPPARKSRRILVAAVGVLVLAAGSAAGAAWMRTGNPDPRGLLAAGDKPAPAHAKPPHFMTLEPFVVNLQDASGDRYAQVGITLQLHDASLDPVFKDRLPAVRNQILLLLSSKRVDELLSSEGKRQLAQQIRQHASQAVAPHGSAGDAASVDDVLFSQFIVQ